jgi:hypothetical protein
MATKAISEASKPYSMALTPFCRRRNPQDGLVMDEALYVFTGSAGKMHRQQRVD